MSAALGRVRRPAGLPGAIDRVLVYAIGLRRRFRGIDVRDGMLLHGPAGWGEFAPFWDYGPAESARWLAAGLEAALRGWPAPRRTRIPTNATIPVCEPQVAAALVRQQPGVTTVKVKVADPRVSPAEDAARVRAVRAALGPAGRIRVDANGAWDAEQALERVAELHEAAEGLEYVEQPCPRVDQLAAVHRRLPCPLAADESVRRATDPLAVVRADACDLIVTKVAPLGGVRPALRLARQAGVPIVVSSALDSSVGLRAGAALAQALPTLPHACGLGTATLLDGDVATKGLTPSNGFLQVHEVAVDDALIAATALPPGLADRWLARLNDCIPYLPEAA